MPITSDTQQRLEIALASSTAAADLLALASAGSVIAQTPPAAAPTFTPASALTGVDGTGSNAAPLAGTNTRLGGHDTQIVALTSLVNSLRTKLIDAGILV